MQHSKCPESMHREGEPPNEHNPRHKTGLLNRGNDRCLARKANPQQNLANMEPIQPNIQCTIFILNTIRWDSWGHVGGRDKS